MNERTISRFNLFKSFEEINYFPGVKSNYFSFSSRSHDIIWIKTITLIYSIKLVSKHFIGNLFCIIGIH